MTDEALIDETPDAPVDMEEAGALLADSLGLDEPTDTEAAEADAIATEEEGEAQAEADAAPAEDAPEAEQSQKGEKPSKSAYEETTDHLWAERRRAIRDAKNAKAEAEELKAKLAADQEALSGTKAIQDLMSTDPVQAMHLMAKRAGMEPAEYYAKMTERHMGDGAPGVRELRGDLEALKADNERIRKESAQRFEQHQTQQRDRFLQARAAEIMGVQEHDALKKQFPHLASIPQHKFADEVLQSVYWAAKNQPDWLDDPIAFAERLDNAAKAEYIEWQERYAALSQVDGTPAKAPVSGNGSRKSTGKSAVTATDTASGGTARDLSDEERMAKANAMLVDL